MSWESVLNNRSLSWNKSSADVNIKENDLKEIAFLLHKAIFNIDKDSFWRYVDWISELLDLENNERIIEVGCGNGSLLLALNEKKEIEAFGLDISQPLLNICHQIYSEKIDNFRIGTYPDGKYDKCLCNSVAQYLDQETVKKIISETQCKRIIFSDVKNILFEDQFKSDQARRQGLTLDERNHKYANTPLTHYSKDFFRSLDYRIKILSMPLYYPDSNYGTFAVIIDKE